MGAMPLFAMGSAAQNTSLSGHSGYPAGPAGQEPSAYSQPNPGFK